VKRHGFAGGPRTHGQKHSEREGGSISTSRIQTVRKGKRMPGRTGGDRITVKNLTILKVDAEKHQLIVKGAVPGRRGTLVEIREGAPNK
jgi:large subunit ribosomal protein L3